MVPVHLDTATEDELMSLPGVGAPSAKNIVRYLRTHKTITKVADLQSCAPHISISQLLLLHKQGSWTSAIQDLKVEDMSKEGTKDTLETQAALPVTPGSETAHENPDEAEIKPDAAQKNLDETTTPQGTLVMTDDMSLQDMMKTLMTTFGNFMSHQTNTNLLYSNRLVSIESEVSQVNRTLKHVSGQFDQLRLEVRTGSAISSHYKRGAAPPTCLLPANSPVAPSPTPEAPLPESDSKRGLGLNKTPDLGTKPQQPDMTREDMVNNLVSQSGSSLPPQQPRDQDNLPDTRHAKLLDKFDGKVGSWENWFHKFEITADMCKWSDASRLFMLTNALTRSALTAHRNLLKSSRSDYHALVNALQERFGKTDSATKAILRTELYCMKQIEGEELEEFADRVYALTMDAHPPETSPAQLQIYAVESFLQGCKDTNSAWLTTTVKNPTTITDAVNQMKLAQSSSRRMKMKLAVRSLSTPDEDLSSLGNLDSEVRRMEAGGDKCYKCGGKWHYAQNCPNEDCPSCEGSGHSQSACPARQSQSYRPSLGHRSIRYNKDRKGAKIRKVSCGEKRASSESASDSN